VLLINPRSTYHQVLREINQKKDRDGFEWRVLLGLRRQLEFITEDLFKINYDGDENYKSGGITN